MRKILLILIIFGFIPSYVWAEFRIEVEPYQGGTELNFKAVSGSASLPQELKVKVNSDTNIRYVVRQIPLEPPDNGKGNFIDWRNFSFYGLMGSLASPNPGTFHVASAAPVGTVSSIDRLYTSSAQGASAEFILVYILNLNEEFPQGIYRGRIKFILEPIESGESPHYAFLNVLVEVRESGETKPKIEITPVSGLSTIYLNSRKEQKQAFDVEVKINKDFKQKITLYQVLVEQPRSVETGESLDYGVLSYQVSPTNIGINEASSLTKFSSGRMDLYTSEATGRTARDFIITYSLGDLSKNKAGIYKGRIYYYLESLGKSELIGELGLEIENERIFELVVVPQDQQTAIEFRNLKPQESPQRNEVIIEIKTNLGKPYQVNQNVFSELTSKEGNIIPFKYFTITLESLDTKGNLKILGKQPLRKGDTVLFISDPQGSSDKFKIIYELSTDWDIKAGDYSTRISYSLLEI
jgi:hypothetical protein